MALKAYSLAHITFINMDEIALYFKLNLKILLDFIVSSTINVLFLYTSGPMAPFTNMV